MPPREKGHSIARNPREEPRQWYPPRAPYLLHGHRVPPSRGVPLSVCYWSFDRRVRFHVFAFHPPSVGDRLKNRPAPRSSPSKKKFARIVVQSSVQTRSKNITEISWKIREMRTSFQKKEKNAKDSTNFRFERKASRIESQWKKKKWNFQRNSVKFPRVK